MYKTALRRKKAVFVKKRDFKVFFLCSSHRNTKYNIVSAFKPRLCSFGLSRKTALDSYYAYGAFPARLNIIDNRRNKMTKYQIFASDLPYPELQVYSISRCDVQALTDDYAGRESETTAIMQYSYQHYILKEKYPEVADVLEKIAIVEMSHHEMLAEAIIQSGGDPIIAGRHCFWSGSTVNYVQDLCHILKADLEGELGAIANYKRTITRLKNKSIIALIERIIIDEELHVKIFKSLIEEYCCE